MKFCNKSIYPRKINHSLSRIGFSLVLSVSLTSVAFADPEGNPNTTVFFQPPPEAGRPEETEGAASRQDRVCSQDSISPQTKTQSDRPQLTAIVPKRNYGLTTAERPTMWVYIPPTSARQAILSIKEEGFTPHWQQSFKLGETGILGIELSDRAPALELGKNYQWAVVLVCGERPNPNDPVVTAWIKRVAQSQVMISQELASDEAGRSRLPSTSLDRASVYAQQGVWYDALNILVAERSSLNNWNELWVQYLQSGGIAEIAERPIIDRQ